MLECYEICLVEPLHDIKNVVNHVFNELCNIIPEVELRTNVATHITALKGKKLIKVLEGENCIVVLLVL